MSQPEIKRGGARKGAGRKPKAATKTVEAAAPEDTRPKRDDVGPGRPPVEHQFKPGNAGRPKGARSKLGEAFLQALADDFDSHGIATIAKVREERPQDYMKVVASLLPKEFKIETTSDLTDDQLNARIRQLASVLEIGVGDAPRGGKAPQGSATAH
jgi:hypothetical protein